MTYRDFGTNKTLYTVYEKPDGLIEIHVLTGNQSVRRLISNHTTDATFFLRIREQYATEDTVAKKWLAKIVSEYRDKFVKNQVSFIFVALSNETLPANVIKHERAERGEITPIISHKCSELAELGFKPVGHWEIDEKLKSSVRYIIYLHKKDRVVYSFCVDGELKYIGVCDNTSTCLIDRMKRYKGMVGEGTNKRVILKIKDCLMENHEVTIWALKPEGELTYKDIRVDLVKGLENPLIQKFKPEWNIKG
jgi:hypothetical protein